MFVGEKIYRMAAENPEVTWYFHSSMVGVLPDSPQFEDPALQRLDVDFADNSVEY